MISAAMSAFCPVFEAMMKTAGTCPGFAKWLETQGVLNAADFSLMASSDATVLSEVATVVQNRCNQSN